METISLARGVPAPECIPVQELADCARAAIERDGDTVLSYGPAGGYQPLREWIAERHGLAARGVDVTAVPMDEDGLDLDALAAALADGDKPAFLYAIPTFQNPSGRTLSTERRRRLVELARAHELLLLEDDPYSLVRYEGEPAPTLFELEGGEHVAYASSFSKTVAPGLRVGYFVLPAGLAAELEALAVS